MGQIYRFLGLEVGTVIPEIDDHEAKRQAYAAGITYGTNNEFGFDYLRDNMAVSGEDQVQRSHRSPSSTRSTRSSSTRRARHSSSPGAPTTRRSSTCSSPRS